MKELLKDPTTWKITGVTSFVCFVLGAIAMGSNQPQEIAVVPAIILIFVSFGLWMKFKK